MKLHLGNRSWLVVAWIVGALLFGPYRGGGRLASSCGGSGFRCLA